MIKFLNVLSVVLTLISVVAFLSYAIIGIDTFTGRIFLIIGLLTIFSAAIASGIYDIYVTKEAKKESNIVDENHNN